jgi:hypothetical protein
MRVTDYAALRISPKIGATSFYVTCGGNAALTGQFTANSFIDTGLASVTGSSLCAGYTGAMYQCFLGLPVPQATSAPVAITNSTGSISSSSASTSIQETNSGCTIAGALASDLIFQVLNQAGAVFGINCMGNAVLTGTLTVTQLIDSGLSSSSTVPLCGPNNGPIVDCATSVAAKCGVVNPTTGQIIECGVVTNASLSCTSLNVCTVGTFNLTTGWGNTSYKCSGNQEGSGTTYANRALIVGFGAPATGSILVNVAAPQTISTQSVSVFVSCTE